MGKTNTYLTVKNVSKYYGIPMRTVYHLVKQGKVKSLKISGKICCLSTDIEHHYNYEASSFINSPQVETYQSDQREYARINTNLSCQYSINLIPIKNITGEGIIKNLSVGGVFLLVQNGAIRDIGADDAIDLSFSLSLKKETKVDVVAKGRVLRKDENGFAVKFRQMDEKLKDDIKEYIG